MNACDFTSYGAFGGVNIGDEAIFWSVSEAVRQSMSGRLVRNVIARHIPHEDATALYQRLKVKFLRKSDLIGIARALAKTDLLIGGGQLFNGSKIPQGLIL